MIICESALIGIIFMLGIYTSVTDIRYGIVSNKSIILGDYEKISVNRILL